MSMLRPLLLDFPEQFESERLLIRAPQQGDGKMLNEAIIESFDELNQWLPWAKEKPTVADSEEHCRSAWAKFLSREDLQLLILLKDSGELVGASGLHRIDWSVPKFEIGYWCRTKRTGAGYISEAATHIARFAFEELGAKRIEIHADTMNKKSYAIAERLGFQLEGVLRNHCLDSKGELRDTRVYSLLKLSDLKQYQRS